jgi:hypothetical protein
MQGFSVDHDAIIRVYDGAGTPTSIPSLKGGTLQFGAPEKLRSVEPRPLAEHGSRTT